MAKVEREHQELIKTLTKKIELLSADKEKISAKLDAKFYEIKILKETSAKLERDIKAVKSAKKSARKQSKVKPGS